MDMTDEDLAKVILGVRGWLGADRDDLMDESDERKWDALTEAASRLRQQSEDSERVVPDVNAELLAVADAWLNRYWGGPEVPDSAFLQRARLAVEAAKASKP